MLFRSGRETARRAASPIAPASIKYGGGADGVEIAVIRAEVDGAIGTDRRRGPYRSRHAVREFPSQRAVGIYRVEILTCTDVYRPAGGDCRRRLRRVADAETPFLGSAAIYRIEVPAGADVNNAVCSKCGRPDGAIGGVIKFAFQGVIYITITYGDRNSTIK